MSEVVYPTTPYGLLADGDYALFFRKAAVEITFENEQYLVVPQAAILALVREPREDIPDY